MAIPGERSCGTASQQDTKGECAGGGSRITTALEMDTDRTSSRTSSSSRSASMCSARRTCPDMAPTQVPNRPLASFALLNLQSLAD